jgi:DHA1 family bicyclomycin/chloramphenicol resistance-like MFS transporter
MALSVRASPRLTALLVTLVAFGPMSVDIYLPALPEMVRVFGTTVSSAQLTLSVFAGTVGVAQLVYGPLTDRFGRRPVLIGAMVLYTVGSLLCLSAQTIGMLIALRIIQAMGACAGPVVARAVVRDLYAREHAARMMAVLAAVVSIAPAVAPIVGGWLLNFGWRANFVVMVLFGLGVLTASWIILGETNRNLDGNALRPWRLVQIGAQLLRDPIFVGNTLSVGFVFVSLFTFVSLASFVLIDVLRVRPDHFGYAFAVTVGAFMVGSTISARLAHRTPLERTIRIGVAIGVASAAAMLILALFGIQTLAAVIAPVTGMSLAVGLVLPNSTAVALAGHPTVAGSASALLGAVQMGSGALAGWVAGQLFDGTTMTLACFMAGGWFATGITQLAMWRHARRAKTSGA